jgi:hypothetical protein
MSNNQATPRILDREGNELLAGCMVTHVDGSGPAPFLEPRWEQGHGWRGQVHWHLRGWPAWETLHPDRAPNTYRCPDLLLTQPASTTNEGGTPDGD